MWGLFMNDMRSSRIEDMDLVAFAASKQALVLFMEKEKTTPYRDERYGKGFRKGGPLEWKNQINEFNNNHFVEILGKDRWVDSEGTLAPEQWAAIESQLLGD